MGVLFNSTFCMDSKLFTAAGTCLFKLVQVCSSCEWEGDRLSTLDL